MKSHLPIGLSYALSHFIFNRVSLSKGFFFMTVLLLFLQTLPCLSQPESARVTFVAAGTGFVQGTCQVSLEDSTGIQSIELVLTDMMSKEVLFTREFAFDQTSGLPTGISWLREGTEVTLGLGTLPKKLAWEGVVRLKNGSGQWSTPYQFLFN